MRNFTFKPTESVAGMVHQLAEYTKSTFEDSVDGELLWTNETPSQAFAGSDISIPVGNYRKLRIVFGSISGTETIILSDTICDLSAKTIYAYGVNTYQDAVNLCFRIITIKNSTTIRIGDNKKCVLENNAYPQISTSNTIMKPLYIYGIK